VLFSLVVGPLPGVEIPAGTARDPNQYDGTIAVLYLQKVWDTLTVEQRRAAALQIDRTQAKSAPRLERPSFAIAPASFVTTDTTMRSTTGLC
jgi:hypothetical protein